MEIFYKLTEENILLKTDGDIYFRAWSPSKQIWIIPHIGILFKPKSKEISETQAERLIKSDGSLNEPQLDPYVQRQQLQMEKKKKEKDKEFLGCGLTTIAIILFIVIGLIFFTRNLCGVLATASILILPFLPLWYMYVHNNNKSQDELIDNLKEENSYIKQEFNTVKQKLESLQKKYNRITNK